MNTILKLFLLTFFIVATCQSANGQDEVKKEKKSSSSKIEMNEKEKAFKKLLTKAKLKGQFTIVGSKKEPMEEEYEISRVEKIAKDEWGFVARIKYGNKNYKVPLTLNVKWADDTPMITLTDLKILGQGPFSSRVIFYNNKYAGTWSHGDVGGHLFGQVTHDDENESDSSDKEDKK